MREKGFFSKDSIEEKKHQIELMNKELEQDMLRSEQQEKIIYRETPTVIVLNGIIIILGIATIVLLGYILFWLKVVGS